MNSKLLIIFFIASAFQVGNVFGFYSLTTDLQFGYQITDIACEISNKLPVIGGIGVRSYYLQTDKRVQTCLRGLTALSTHLKNPVTFFNEIQSLGFSRVNTEATHVTRLNNAYVTLAKALDLALNSSGLLGDLREVIGYSDVAKIEYNLKNILDNSEVLRDSFVELAKDVTPIRTNITSFTVLTPTHIRENLNETIRDQILRSLKSIRNSVEFVTHSIKDASRVALAQGSIYDTLNRYYSTDFNTKKIALNNFNNSHNRAMANIVSVAKINYASAHSVSNTFVTKVRQRYNDDIVRPVFEEVHLPEINNFVNLTVDIIYNVEAIENSFNIFRDTVLQSQRNTSDQFLDEAIEFREKILTLQKTPYYVREYSPCIDDLVSTAQLLTREGSSKYVKCINERTSGVNIILPTIRSALNIFRDNFNLVFEQLTACISYAVTVDGRTQTAECIESSMVNLPIMADFMVHNAQNSVRKIIEGQIRIYESCLRVADSNVWLGVNNFDVVHNYCEKLGNGDIEPSTTSTSESTKTQENTSSYSSTDYSSSDTTLAEETTILP